jgi:hypothetical protein
MEAAGTKTGTGVLPQHVVFFNHTYKDTALLQYPDDLGMYAQCGI